MFCHVNQLSQTPYLETLQNICISSVVNKDRTKYKKPLNHASTGHAKWLSVHMFTMAACAICPYKKKAFPWNMFVKCEIAMRQKILPQVTIDKILLLKHPTWERQKKSKNFALCLNACACAWASVCCWAWGLNELYLKPGICFPASFIQIVFYKP